MIVPPPKTEAEVEERLNNDHEKLSFYLMKRDLFNEEGPIIQNIWSLTRLARDWGSELHAIIWIII